MLQFRRMLPSDLLGLRLQTQQARFRAFVERAEYRDMLAAGRFAMTVLAGDRVIGCGGIVAQWDAPHLGRAWALVGEDVPRECWRAITNFTRGVLAAAMDDMPAIECEVDMAHRQGHRWAHLLGFRLTGIRPYRQADTMMPAAHYTFARAEGVPTSVGAALDFLDRVVAAWLAHPPGTDPTFLLKASLPAAKKNGHAEAHHADRA